MEDDETERSQRCPILKEGEESNYQKRFKLLKKYHEEEEDKFILFSKDQLT